MMQQLVLNVSFLISSAVTVLDQHTMQQGLVVVSILHDAVLAYQAC